MRNARNNFPASFFTKPKVPECSPRRSELTEIRTRRPIDDPLASASAAFSGGTAESEEMFHTTAVPCLKPRHEIMEFQRKDRRWRRCQC